MHSTHAIGTQHPDPKSDIIIPKDVTVPLGKVVEQCKDGRGANEFIVYNTNQVRMKYII
jgi:hypothetical protein